MRDDQERTVEFVEKFGDPFDGFRVQVVGWLVENQQVGVRDQGAAHGHAPFLAAGKCFNPPVGGGTVQVRHRGLDAPVQRPAFQGGDAMFQFLVPFRVVRQRFKSAIKSSTGFAPSRIFSSTFFAGSSMKSCGR